MRIEFNLCEEDMFLGLRQSLLYGPISDACRKSIRKHARPRQVIAFSVSASVLIAWAIVLPTLGMHYADGHQLLLLISFSVAIGFAYWGLRQRELCQKPEAALIHYAIESSKMTSWKGFVGPVTIEINQEGLVVDLILSKTVYLLDAIDGMDRTEEYLYIYLMSDGCIPVPIRDLEDLQQADAFCDEFEKYSGKEIRLIPA